MIRALAFAALASIAASNAATAALPPYWQRVEEMEKIMSDGRVQEGLQGGWIDKIEWVSDDVYRVTGGSCTIEVEIVDSKVDMPEGWVGPRQFEILPRKPVCK